KVQLDIRPLRHHGKAESIRDVYHPKADFETLKYPKLHRLLNRQSDVDILPALKGTGIPYY
ncbi:MAG: hypothetical protein WCJ11_12770, partial [Methylococcaceae bacterium]